MPSRRRRQQVRQALPEEQALQPLREPPLLPVQRGLARAVGNSVPNGSFNIIPDDGHRSYLTISIAQQELRVLLAMTDVTHFVSTYYAQERGGEYWRGTGI